MDRTVQEDIIYKVTGVDPRYSGRFKNPFRQDNNPSCFWQWYKGYLRLIDNSDKRFFNMNCWDMVMHKHSCDFSEAKKLVSSWNMGMPVKVETPEDDFQITLTFQNRAWNKRDAVYWGKYGITLKQLEDDGVQPVKSYQYNSRKCRNNFFTKYPQMGYALSARNKLKIYSPYEQPKFITNAKNDDLFFTNYPVGDTLFIVSSYKDGRVLINLGYDVRGLQGETMIPSWKIIKQMSEKCKNIYISLDGDTAGRQSTDRFIEEAKMLELENIHPFYFPESLLQYGKDYADVYSRIPNSWDIKRAINNLL